jgi:GNAT superfamily N-acetyltransferase
MSEYPEIRPALSQEAAELSSLAVRSKAHWAYSDEFMESCRDELTYSPEEIASDYIEFRVIEEGGRIAGFYALKQLSIAIYELDALYVDPLEIGKEYGSLLLDHAMSAAKERDVERLQIQSDPNAIEFYTKAGAVQIGTKESGSIAGRFLPLLEIDLRGQ